MSFQSRVIHNWVVSQGPASVPQKQLVFGQLVCVPKGIVRLTGREPADRRRSRLSCRELTPLGQGGRAVLFEDIAAVEVAVVVEVVVD